MVSGWSDHKIVAPMTFKGYCNTLLIEAWVEHYLEKTMHQFDSLWDAVDDVFRKLS